MFHLARPQGASSLSPRRAREPQRAVYTLRSQGQRARGKKDIHGLPLPRPETEQPRPRQPRFPGPGLVPRSGQLPQGLLGLAALPTPVLLVAPPALPALPTANVIEEPMPRNTAPCIGLAAAVAVERDPDAVLLCLPADHVIKPEDVFRDACRKALRRRHHRAALWPDR